MMRVGGKCNRTCTGFAFALVLGTRNLFEILLYWISIFKPVFMIPYAPSKKLILFFLTLVVFGLSACRKIDSPVIKDDGARSKFFDDRNVTSSQVKLLIQSIKKEDLQYNFAIKFIEQAGYPRWNKTVSSRPNSVGGQYSARGNGEADTTYFYTPFVSDELNNVQAVLISRAISSDTMYKFIVANDYDDFPIEPSLAGGKATATDVATLFLFFERSVFENETFLAKDQGRAFAVPATRYIKHQSVTTTSFSVTVCSEIWIDPDPEGTDIFHVSGNESYYDTDCKTTFIGSGGGQGGNPSPPSEGSGGLITGLYAPNIHPFTSNPGEQIAQFQAQSPVHSFDGWGPTIDQYEPEVEAVEDDDITDPCLKTLLQTIGTAGHKSYILKTYDNTQTTPSTTHKYTIKYLQDDNLKNAGGTPIPGHTIVADKGANNYEVTITLNPTLFASASKEWATTVILHELMHGIMSANNRGGSTNETSHKWMFNNKVPIIIAQSLRELFPSMSVHDSLALGMDGMSEAYMIDDPTNPGTQTIDPVKDQFAQDNYFQSISQAASTIALYQSGSSGTSFC
jgi:hypothetical protein